MLPTASVYLLLSSNTPYFVVPAEKGNIVGRWDGEVDGGSPVLRDLRFESLDTTRARLGRMVLVAEAGRELPADALRILHAALAALVK